MGLYQQLGKVFVASNRELTMKGDNEHIEHDRLAKERIIKDIKEFCCHLALLESDGYIPAFVYSIGLFKNFKHPEIITFGLTPNLMGSIINHAKDEIKKGVEFKSGINYEGFIEDYPIQFVEVDKEHYRDYLGYAGWFYDNSWEFPVLQLIWPDKDKKWPWEESFNENWKFKQPLLDRNIDFKFYEQRNLGVYTTQHVLEGKPILYVYHNDNGDWQFHSEFEPNIEDSKLVCLEQLVKRDPTLNGIHYLNFGQTAWRENIGEEWNVTDNNEE